MRKIVHIVNGSAAYMALFRSFGFAITPDVEHAGLVCFTGGSDVSPELYGDKKHELTYNDRERDDQEIEIFKKCLANNTPMVGICRGAQFLNVMSGGRMYQHVSEHATYHGHEITDVMSGRTLLVSSTHHQMMMPASDAVLVAFSDLHSYREWYDGEVKRTDVSKRDIEVVFYQKTNCLCFQPHPEFSSKEFIPMQVYFFGLLNHFFNRGY